MHCEALREDAAKRCDVSWSWKVMWDVVHAQINRKVGKKGNDTRKNKSDAIGSQGSRK